AELLDGGLARGRVTFGDLVEQRERGAIIWARRGRGTRGGRIRRRDGDRTYEPDEPCKRKHSTHRPGFTQTTEPAQVRERTPGQASRFPSGPRRVNGCGPDRQARPDPRTR